MAVRMQDAITRDFSTSPMYPMYFLYHSGGVYYYSAYCCDPADPDWATIQSNIEIPRGNLGCPRPGGGTTSGVETEFLAQSIRAIPDGRNSGGDLKTRMGIANGAKIDSGSRIPRLPASHEIPQVDPADVGGYCVVEDLYAGGDAGNLVTLMDDAGRDLYPGRMFRVRKISDIFAGREFVAALSIRFDASLNPVPLAVYRTRKIALTPGLSPAVAYFPMTGNTPDVGPNWDIVIVNHDLA